MHMEFLALSMHVIRGTMRLTHWIISCTVQQQFSWRANIELRRNDDSENAHSQQILRALLIKSINNNRANRFLFPIRKPQPALSRNTVQHNNRSALGFYAIDIPMVSAVRGACQDVAGPCNRQPFPPRARWLTKTQQAMEPKRPAIRLPSTQGYSAIPIVNKGVKQLEIENHINFSFNEHLLYWRLSQQLSSEPLPYRNMKKKSHFTMEVVIPTSTWSQLLADLCFDNDSTVYMEGSKSYLSVISARHRTSLWSDMRRKWGNQGSTWQTRPNPGILGCHVM